MQPNKIRRFVILPLLKIILMHKWRTAKSTNMKETLPYLFSVRSLIARKVSEENPHDVE